MKKEDLPKEKIEWISKDKARMTIEKEISIDDGTTKGVKKEHTVVETMAEEIIQGLELMKTRLEKNTEKKGSLEKQRESKGKKPLRTPEMVKLEKNFQALQKIAEIGKIEQQLKSLETQIEWDTELIKRRQELLDQRPKE